MLTQNALERWVLVPVGLLCGTLALLTWKAKERNAHSAKPTGLLTKGPVSTLFLLDFWKAFRSLLKEHAAL